MYIHLGQNTVVNDKEIIGVFDLETTTVSKITRDYLSKNEKKKNVYYVSAELPRCLRGKKNFCLSPFAGNNREEDKER